MAYKLGNLEFLLTFTPADGGEPVETVSTPSMFALAEEWVDEAKLEGKHSEEWCESKFGPILWLQAARDLGLVPDGPLDNASACGMLNAYEVDMKDRDDLDEGPNPTPTVPEAAQAAL